jgi:hypothetical protein
MDFSGLVDFVWAERETVNAHMPAFLATVTIGAVAGWTVGYFYWKQRLDLYMDANKHLEAALAEKIPAAAALRRTRPKGGSQRVTWGLGLIVLALAIGTVGAMLIYFGNKSESKDLTFNKEPSNFPVVVPVVPITPTRIEPSPVPSPALSPLFNDYRLTPAGIKALADELYKIKDVVKPGDIRWMANDGQTLALATDFSKAYDRAGIDNALNMGRPNSPNETGVILMVNDPENEPASAKKFVSALKAVGIKSTLIRRDVGTEHFVLLIGPRPEN